MSLFETNVKTSIQNIKSLLSVKDEESKKILAQFPEINLTSDIEKKLYFNEKLREALKNPGEYFKEKEEKLKNLGIKVNTEFVNAFNELKEFTDKIEAKNLALEKAKTFFNIEMHKINQIFPPKIDTDLENKLLIDLRNKIINPKHTSAETKIDPDPIVKTKQTEEIHEEK